MKTQPADNPKLSADQAAPIGEYWIEDKEWLFEAVQNANETVIVTQDGFIKFCNPQAIHLSGYSFRELASKPLTEFIHPEDRERVFDAHHHRLRGEVVPRVYTFRLINKAGQIKWIENIGVRMTWEGKPATLGFLTDLTDRQRWQEQYYQAQKLEAMGRLATEIVHDFNHMVTTVNGFAALIQDRFSLDDPIREVINQVLRSGERAADLMHQLLTFSRKQMIEPQVLNLNTVLADMDKMLRRISGEAINLKTVPAQDLWPVKVDPTQMDQIILNLAVNACEAMPGGGQLTIETANVALDDDYAALHFGAQPGEYVLLAVGDTGRGISHEMKSRLFEPFFTTKEAGQGTGLGLATVYGIVKQNGGHIEVQSEENRGTIFKVYLPRAVESKYSSASTQIGEKTPAGHETILIVEDTTPVRELVHRILQKHGYILLEAQNGEEALRLITNYAGPIHLLLTDIVMPGISGKTLADEAAHLRPEMKVLYISGYTDEKIIDQGAAEPGNAFLQKPFNPTELARKVRAVLDS